MENMSEPQDAAGTEREGPPWENPSAGDFFQRLWQTVVQGVSSPSELFANMRTTGGLISPLVFYVLIIGAGAIVSTALEMPFGLLGGSGGADAILGFFLVLILLPVLLPIGLFVSSGITHLALMVFGGANKPYEATFRVNAYAYGSVGWVWAIPFCGSLVGGIWGIVLEIIGVARVHEVSTGKAAAAVLVPLAIIAMFGACVALIFGLAVFGMADHS
ncbi:MAG: hypothetical protein EA370_11840 [Wenzhouxiangella sp.]|nr:MAG: hypothetical protein EA370_11840 [Wenzhouxiangella sp.]